MLYPRPTEAQTGGTDPGAGIQQNLQVILKVLICLFIFVCMLARVFVSADALGSQRRPQVPGTRVRDGCEPPHGVVSPHMVLGMQPRSSAGVLSSLNH